MLFQANAKCTLASQHSSLSNTVKDLSFDKQTGLLTVTQTALTGGNADEGSQQFRGLERVGYAVDGTANGWTYRSTTLVSSAGGVTAMLGPYGDDGGVLVDLPALDVRAELNEGEDKLPDDGKLHFEGVTTDATPTVIAQIPVAENELCIVDATVSSAVYNDPTTLRVYGKVRQTLARAIGGNISSSLEITKLMEEGNANTDVDIDEDTTPNTVRIKVTGVAGFRSVWKASVELQRISDKQYER